MSKFYDTCALLNMQEKAFEEHFMCSYITLPELENIKTSSKKDEETKYKARKLIHLLDKNSDKYETIFYCHDILVEAILKYGVEVTNDSLIIQSAKNKSEEEDIVFITDDICCKMIAREIFGLNVDCTKKDKIEEYKGFKDVKMSEEEMANFYQNLNNNIYGLLENQYIIIRNNNGDVVDQYRWHRGCYESIYKKPIKSTMFGSLKAYDEIQSCAIDSVVKNDITVLYGKSGCGKTTIPLNYIMEGLEKHKFSKCYFIYSFEPLKGSKTLGFEKGDHKTKLLQTASIGGILSSKFGDMYEVEKLMDEGVISIIPTSNIRGVEFEADSAVIVTEAQNLDSYTLKTIIQRCKIGCKQIYEGDILEQKDTNIQELGMNRLIEVFKGTDKFGCVS